MLVFVAGGSGAIGRPLVSRLARAGHNVVATTRAAEQAQLIRDADAEPVVVDAFDTDAFRRAIVSAKPDVVVHEMTALAKPAADYASWLTDTNRLRGSWAWLPRTFRSRSAIGPRRRPAHHERHRRPRSGRAAQRRRR